MLLNAYNTEERAGFEITQTVHMPALLLNSYKLINFSKASVSF